MGGVFLGVLPLLLVLVLIAVPLLLLFADLGRANRRPTPAAEMGTTSSPPVERRDQAAAGTLAPSRPVPAELAGHRSASARRRGLT